MPTPLHILAGLAVLGVPALAFASRKRPAAESEGLAPPASVPVSAPREPVEESRPGVLQQGLALASAGKEAAGAVGGGGALAGAQLGAGSGAAGVAATVAGGLAVSAASAVAGKAITGSNAGLAAGLTPTVGLPAAVGFRATTEALQAVGLSKGASDAAGVGAAGGVALAAATGVGALAAAPLVGTVAVVSAGARALGQALGFGGDPAKNAVAEEKTKLEARFMGEDAATAANVQRYREHMATPLVQRGIRGRQTPKQWADHGFAQGKFTGVVMHDGALFYSGKRYAPQE